MAETLTIESVEQATIPKRVKQLATVGQDPREVVRDENGSVIGACEDVVKPVHYHEFEVEIETEWWSENYGSDADGNRGERRSYSENSSSNLIDMIMTVRDGVNELGYPKWKTLRRTIDINKISDPEVVSQIECAIEKYEPEPPPSQEDYERDYDEDR